MRGDEAGLGTPEGDMVSLLAASTLTGIPRKYLVCKRTEGSELFINPLMGMYWSFRLDPVVRRNLLLEHIGNTQTFSDLSVAIERFRDRLPKTRPWSNIPC